MAGGGTGGHVFPIRSLLVFFYTHKIYQDQVQKLFRFGSRKSLEQKICHEIQESGKENQLQFLSIFS
jgi:UDP-N-acetylglucosamine:LPS N-acetylglucosamine transferase